MDFEKNEKYSSGYYDFLSLLTISKKSIKPSLRNFVDKKGGKIVRNTTITIRSSVSEDLKNKGHDLVKCKNVTLRSWFFNNVKASASQNIYHLNCL